MDDLILSILDTARHIIDRPIYVTSAYRCARHNAAVGGVADSQHLRGRAADVYADGVTVDELAAVFRSLHAGGIGRYHGAGFVHVDTRSGYPSTEWEE